MKDIDGEILPGETSLITEVSLFVFNGQKISADRSFTLFIIY